MTTGIKATAEMRCMMEVIDFGGEEGERGGWIGERCDGVIVSGVSSVSTLQ